MNILDEDGRPMTLRDYLAAHALQGIMANPERWKQVANDYITGKKTYDEASASNVIKAYNLADEALAARKWGGSGKAFVKRKR